MIKFEPYPVPGRRKNAIRITDKNNAEDYLNEYALFLSTESKDKFSIGYCRNKIIRDIISFAYSVDIVVCNRLINYFKDEVVPNITNSKETEDMVFHLQEAIKTSQLLDSFSKRIDTLSSIQSRGRVDRIVTTHRIPSQNNDSYRVISDDDWDAIQDII